MTDPRCACTKHAGADGSVRLHPDAGCPVHGAIRGARCACVTVSFDRAYPSPGCILCGGTGYLASRPALPLRHRVVSLPAEQFARVAGAARRASVLATGEDATDLAMLADQLEVTVDAPAELPSRTAITSLSRGDA